MDRKRWIETIRVEGGSVFNLPYHQMRVDRTLASACPCGASGAVDLASFAGTVACPEDGLFKLRIVWDGDGISEWSISPYARKEYRSLAVVCGDGVRYSCKSEDRSCIDELFAQRNGCDDVLIVRDGLITDTSIFNVALYDGQRWLTPSIPLLEGTQRASLLDRGILVSAELKAEDLCRFSHIALFNSMNPFGIHVYGLECDGTSILKLKK